MTEILTESFCERCGTRYTFESAAPRQRRLGRLKVLGRGLQHFVMTDDSSLDESIAAARSDIERDATNNQLDAFHRTFSFCMSCRQYTCTNCWNETEARCLSCAPLEVAELAPVFDTEIDTDRLLRFVGGQSEVGHDHHQPAAPFATTPTEAAATEPAIFALTDPWIGAGNGADVEAAAEPLTVEPRDHEPAAPAEPEAVEPRYFHAAEPAAQELLTPEPPYIVDEPMGSLDGLADGQSLDDAIAAFELGLEVETTTPVAAPSAGTESLDGEAAPELLGSEPSVSAEPAPEALAAEPLPSPMATEPDALNTVVPESAPAVPSGPDSMPTAVDSVVQPVWRAPADPTATPPQWPTGPRWPTGLPAQATPTAKAEPVDALAALIARSSTDAMWAASSQEIFQPAAVKVVASVHSCGNCGISLSANARFCRRCGTPQG